MAGTLHTKLTWSHQSAVNKNYKVTQHDITKVE